ncbi:MAG: phosphoribosylformimino-5-aminoimidazole carboxamide ribotide isomerase [Actinomycetota bacterium]|nr:phosphoribosylformimino-5-aminoimidazole carboxamide ribotide isomerase [Actinomycetota bacterium]
MFDVFVAIDLVGGRVVRLLRGDPEAATVYSEDPVAMAREWQERGATWLHVVDLEGAISGEPANAGVMRGIIEAVDVPVQVAGGIRSLDAIDAWLAAGAARVVVGTRAIEEAFLSEAVPRFGQGLVAAVDARDGMVQVGGWQASSSLTTGEVVSRLSGAGVPRMLFTDIGRDGTLEGPNLTAIRDVLAASGMGLIASGGVAGLGDVETLLSLGHPRLEGVIVGKALYSGSLVLEDALAAVAGARVGS